MFWCVTTARMNYFAIKPWFTADIRTSTHYIGCGVLKKKLKSFKNTWYFFFCTITVDIINTKYFFSPLNICNFLVFSKLKIKRVFQ